MPSLDKFVMLQMKIALVEMFLLNFVRSLFQHKNSMSTHWRSAFRTVTYVNLAIQLFFITLMFSCLGSLDNAIICSSWANQPMRTAN